MKKQNDILFGKSWSRYFTSITNSSVLFWISLLPPGQATGVFWPEQNFHGGNWGVSAVALARLTPKSQRALLHLLNSDITMGDPCVQTGLYRQDFYKLI